MEFLYSDEGQNLWLDGYCHPIRYEDLVAADAVPQEQLDRLPDEEGAVFPTPRPDHCGQRADHDPMGLSGRRATLEAE